MPDNLLNAIRLRVDEINAAGGELFDALKAGDSVVIESGPFAGYEAIFDARLPGADRVRVLLKLLRRRQLPVELPVAQIRRKNSPLPSRRARRLAGAGHHLRFRRHSYGMSEGRAWGSSDNHPAGNVVVKHPTTRPDHSISREFFMVKKALVCGAGGFIGGHLVKKLKREGYWVRGVDIKAHEFAPTPRMNFCCWICGRRRAARLR